MAGRDRTAPGEKTIRQSAKGEHFECAAVNRQRAGLSDPIGAPLEYRDPYLRQRQLTGKPQSNRTTADDDDLEIIAHERRPGV
jgi:hypothetical protein